MLDREEKFQLTLTLTKSQIAHVDRAKEVLAARGQNPSNEQVVLKAIDDLLTKRDPMQKAARALARAEQKEKSEATGTGAVANQVPICLGTRTKSRDADQVISQLGGARTSRVAKTNQTLSQLPQNQQTTRPAIAERVKHEVYLRDQGQCTFAYANGRRCPSKSMLEIDHKIMWCRGGDHSVGNLMPKCREHNQLTAKMELGLARDAYAKAAWQTTDNCCG